MQAFTIEAREDQTVDFRARPARVADSRARGTLRGNERPQQLPFRSLIDPAADGVDFFIAQFFAAGVRGRHAQGAVGADAAKHFALVRLSGNDGFAASREVDLRPTFDIETELRLTTDA